MFDLVLVEPEIPPNAGNVIRPEDKRNFTLLTAEFRKQLDEQLDEELAKELEKHFKQELHCEKPR